ncbi:MAG: ATP synthase F1 subunit epsilon [Bryobacteraceae bacterium]|jgi:F-type H+-transporting ATPase subunit epsilon
MPDSLELEVATPERLLVREQATEVQVSGKNGYMGILPGHAALLSRLGSGVLDYVAGGQRRYLAVAGGFLEVLPGHVRVLADVAERAEEIDAARARAALQRAQQEVGKIGGEDPAVALAAMERAQARVAAAERK